MPLEHCSGGSRPLIREMLKEGFQSQLPFELDFEGQIGVPQGEKDATWEGYI